jgi:hypothetical protein
MDLTEKLSLEQINAFSAVFGELINIHGLSNRQLSIEDIAESFESTIRSIYRLGFTDGYNEAWVKQQHIINNLKFANGALSPQDI